MKKLSIAESQSKKKKEIWWENVMCTTKVLAVIMILIDDSFQGDKMLAFDLELKGIK